MQLKGLLNELNGLSSRLLHVGPRSLTSYCIHNIPILPEVSLRYKGYKVKSETS